MAIITSFILFQDLDLRCLVFLGLYAALGEIFVHLRWRLSVLCMECGFDPLVYLRNPELAAKKVKATLAQRDRHPENWLKPALKIPIRIIGPDKRERVVTNASPELRAARMRMHTSQQRHAQKQGKEQAQQSQAVTARQNSQPSHNQGA